MRFHLKKIIKVICSISLVIVFINIYNYYQSNLKVNKNLFNSEYIEANDNVLHKLIKKLPVNKDRHQLDYISKFLDVQYNIVANIRDQFVVNLVMKNKGDESIKDCCWTIYFYHTKYLNTDAINSGFNMIVSSKLNFDQSFVVKHVNGYTYSISPSHKYMNFEPGDTKVLQIFGNGWMVSKSEVIPNWYVANDEVDLEPKLIESTVGEGLSFVGSFIHDNQTLRSTLWDQAKPFSVKSRYKMNSITDAGKSLNLIIPTPLKIKVSEVDSLVVNIENQWNIIYTDNLISEANFLKSHLIFLSIQRATTTNTNVEYSIRLKIDVKIIEQIPETASILYLPHAYSLIINAEEKKIVIVGATNAAVFYGIISLFSLAGISSPRQGLTEIRVPATLIIDAPRYEHRGVMVDVARNFHTKEELFKLMDALVLYKLNVLHLHLVDDEGWRIQIPGLPELTNVGGHRSHDLAEDESLISMLGSGPNNKTSGSGYYSVKDYQEILKYADSRHIQVIPEIDMPGHSHAAIKSMQARYKRLKQTHNKTEAKKFLVSDLHDKSFYMSGQHFKDCALNACIESTYRFVGHVVNELIKMHKSYQPLQRYHFGGDEVPQNAYTGSIACLRFLEANTNVRGFSGLKPYFIRRLMSMLANRNLSVIGWEDAYSSEQNEQMQMSEIKAREAIIQYYLNNWEGGAARRPYDYANDGFKVILSPITALYFDNPQEPDPNDWGLHWGTRYSNTKRTFNFAPENIYNSIDFDFSGRRLDGYLICEFSNNCPKLQKPENILGLEGAMWSELIRTESRMDSMLWPRLLAVAERSWHRANWETAINQLSLTKERNSDWVKFANTIGYKELKRLEVLKVEYYLPRVGARLSKGTLNLNSMFPGLKFTVSQDKGRTWEDYDPLKKYNGQTIQVSTRSFDNQKRKKYRLRLCVDTTDLRSWIVH